MPVRHSPGQFGRILARANAEFTARAIVAGREDPAVRVYTMSRNNLTQVLPANTLTFAARDLADTLHEMAGIWDPARQIPVVTDPAQARAKHRILLGSAAIEAYGVPVIAVDFGTATTFDVVNERREYLGGIIVPGLKIGAEALFQRASRLPRVELAEPERLVGRNTVQAMQSGLFYGYVGQVDGILTRLLAEYPGSGVVATGGLARIIAPSTQHIHHVAPDLTLDGLKLLWLRNRG